MMKPAEILAAMIHSGEEKVSRPLYEKAILGFVGGAMISLGYLLYIRSIASVAESLGSLASLIGASVFPIGLIVIIMGGGELVTSNMAAVATSLFAKKINIGQLIANWIVITIFNIIGAICVAYFFGHVVGLTHVGVYQHEILTVANAKLSAGPLATFISGIGCNWFVGAAVWMAYGAKDAAGKLLAIWFPIMAFVAIGFQHSIANAFAIPAAIFEGGTTWLRFWQNFGLVYLGNIVGGAIFLAAFYYISYKRQMKELSL
ncbi:formate/nitrite transporter family protein [Lactococcus termiticola]|uniref:Formate/nitrite transporter n=1 Tax=Lactococcus termiticola TaxID=2169526 RepID=A0A2R5HE99_9LACT|nr:formate/nitrite transporter family protein [Lactococcus termiticola]GBG96403.1 formate/nitrite transporter [Lactococcus termiticola]